MLVRLVSMTIDQSLMEYSAAGARRIIVALLTRMSIEPKCSTSAEQTAGSRTSPFNAMYRAVRWLFYRVVSGSPWAPWSATLAAARASATGIFEPARRSGDQCRLPIQTECVKHSESSRLFSQPISVAWVCNLEKGRHGSFCFELQKCTISECVSYSDIRDGRSRFLCIPTHVSLSHRLCRSRIALRIRPWLQDLAASTGRSCEART